MTYLEENLVELQSSNRNMILERQDAEGRLREELDNLKVLVDAMTVPLWQFGECGVTGRTLASRIRLPVCGDVVEGVKRQEFDGVESLESLEESIVSYEEEENYDDDSEYENDFDSPEAPDLLVQMIAQSNVQMRDASTQTVSSSSGKETITGATTTHQLPLLLTSKNIASRNDVLNVPMMSCSHSTQPKDQEHAKQTSVATVAVDGNSAVVHDTLAPMSNNYVSNGYYLSEEHLFGGGKPVGSQPCRFVPKYGFLIRPGVLKECKAKSERVSRSVRA